MAGTTRRLRRHFGKAFDTTCSGCRSPIAAEDMDVAEGTMVCRGCGKISVIAGPDQPQPDLRIPFHPEDPPPTQPTGSRTLLEQAGADFIIRHKCGSIGAGLFLLFWLFFWSLGTGLLLRKTIAEPQAEHVLFCVPFVAAWLLVAVLVPYQFFGYERLRLGRDELEYDWGLFKTLGTRVLPLSSIRDVRRFATVGDSESGRLDFGLRIQTADGPIRFAKGSNDEELYWLADVIRRHLSKHAPDSASMPAGSVVRTGLVRPKVEVLARPSSMLSRPAGSNLRLRRDHFLTVISSRATLSSVTGPICMLLFVNAFWNGIVGIFVLQLCHSFSWFLALFLVPFVAIGLGMVIFLLAALVGLMLKTTWTVRPGEIIERTSMLGVGRSRSYRFDALSRIEIRNTSATKKWEISGSSETLGSKFRLALVGRDGQDVITIGDFSESEVRWIASELFHDFGEWFVKVDA